MNWRDSPCFALFLLGSLGIAGCATRPADVDIAPERGSAETISTNAVPRSSASTALPSPSGSVQSPIAPDARIVSFTVHTPKVGERFHAHAKVHGELEASAIVKTIRSVWDDDTEKDVEVLAVAGGTVTKIQITYTKVLRTRVTNGVAKPNPGPIEGRSYIVERKDRVLVTALDGRPLTEPEDTEIRNGLSGFGKPDLVANALASKSRRVGERLDDVAAAMKSRFDADEAESAKPGEKSMAVEMTATLFGIEGASGDEVAVVEITSSMTGEKFGADATIVTHGANTFRIEGSHLVKTHVDGVTTIKGLLSGAGKMTVDMDSTVLPPRAP